MSCLYVWIDVCVSVSLVIFDNRAQVLSSYFNGLKTRQLGLECICEGVETQAHIELLKRYGCDLAQGYFFDKPIPVEEFEQRLEKG